MTILPDVVKDLARKSDGPLAEIGVFRGDTFRTLQQLTVETVHAFDSFQGLSEPSEDDGKHYKAGDLACSREEFEASLTLPNYQIWEGWVPQVFLRVDEGLRFGFVHIDLDLFDPTLSAALWSWSRLRPGGVLVFHDYCPSFNGLATKAILRFLAHASSKTWLRVHTPFKFLVVEKPREEL